jgi:hypothetical protein
MSQARIYHTQQVHYLIKEVTFEDNGTAVILGRLPANSVIIACSAIVAEAFNAGTTNVLDIGTTDDADGLATDLALGTVGLVNADEMGTSNDLYHASEINVTATVALTGTAATAGSAFVHICYMPISNG